MHILNDIKETIQAVNLEAERHYIIIRIRGADKKDALIKTCCMTSSSNDLEIHCTRSAKNQRDHIARDRKINIIKKCSDSGTY